MCGQAAVNTAYLLPCTEGTATFPLYRKQGFHVIRTFVSMVKHLAHHDSMVPIDCDWSFRSELSLAPRVEAGQKDWKKGGSELDAFSAARDLLEDAVASDRIPGAVAICGRKSEILFQFHCGFAQVYPVARQMQHDTLFDVASLTKVMATLPALLILVERGQISLDTPLSDYFPAFAEVSKRAVRVKHLITHTSGLVAKKPFLWERFEGTDAIIAAALAEPLDTEPGARVAYSDYGYIIAGALVEQVSRRPLAEFLQDTVFGPLQMHDTTFNPTGAKNIAATEVERGVAKLGVVHDKTAAAMGGIAGHAGLFSSARDMARYLGMWVGGPGPLAQNTCEHAVGLQTPGLTGRRGWGWVLRGDSQDISGDLWPDTVASHTGFTGTSTIFDRPSGAWAVLLTNRVHFGRHIDIGSLRRQFHNAVAYALFP
ncbi:MAG: serine hydrolase domain-containing protein [Sulfobacillus sp.]